MPYYEDEYDDQEYKCQNAGCAGDRIFIAVEEQWFEDNDLDLPKNCEICREWNSEQKRIGPITAKCQFCGFTWPIEATYRIIYHKKVGNWDAYWSEQESLQICRRCMEMPFRRRKLRERRAESKLPREKRTPKEQKRREQAEHESLKERLLEYVEEHGLGEDPERFDVPDTAIFYERIKTPARRVARHGENQLTHILKKDHEWLEKFGNEDPHTILALACLVAASTEEHVLQFTDQRSQFTVKYDLDQEVAVVLREDDMAPAGVLIHTAFPKVLKGAYDTLQEGHWA